MSEPTHDAALLARDGRRIAKVVFTLRAVLKYPPDELGVLDAT